jgi:uncharacterized radical SAM superfamily Fe-S cluster-containing enzyme
MKEQHHLNLCYVCKMPNIILTEYCNLKCPYCFASKMIEDAKENDFNKNITEE